MSRSLVRVDNVSKKLSRDLRKSLRYGVQDLVGDLLGRQGDRDVLRPSEFWAVRQVSCSVRRGECLALIGRNGAGKTTLLRMMNGLVRPDTGRIEMHGAVGAMIALGAGMKEVLTGRDNISCMAALRGMTRREADRKMDEIIDFAEMRESIDAPLQSYSSGMRVRLNFAIASSLEPDILLLDEVLAVGDAAFRNKCYHRIAELRRKAAVIFVSHNMEQIARTSTQAMVMHRGQVAYAGSVEDGIRVYGQLNQESGGDQLTAEAFLSLHPPVTGFSATIPAEIRSGEPVDAEMVVDAACAQEGFKVKVLFYNARGDFAADGCIDTGVSLVAGRNRLRVRIDSLPLKNGDYAVGFNLIDSAGDLVVWSYKQHQVRIDGAYPGGVSDCQLRLGLR